MTETSLEMERRRVIEGAKRVARQEALITKLDRDGYTHMLADARSLLAQLQSTQQLSLEHFECLESEAKLHQGRGVGSEASDVASMTRDITSIVDDALSQARSCILEPQATEAGHFFGSDLADSENGQDRRSTIQAALDDALAQTVPGSYARAFMNAVVSALDDAWGHLVCVFPRF